MPIKHVFAIFSLTLLFTSGLAQSQNLVTNGDFEAGLTNWTSWAAAPSSFWNGVWILSNDCDIWIPTNGCPYEGSTSYAQKKGSGAGNAHGGIYQTLSVEVGETYNIEGFWSGGVTGNLDGNNATWWEVVIYDDVVSDAIIDAGVRSQDVLIAKMEQTNLASNAVFQFQWEQFNGSFVPQSDTVTLAFKAGSYYTHEAAGYLDLVSVTKARITPVPTMSAYGVVVTMLGLLLVTGRRLHASAK